MVQKIATLHAVMKSTNVDASAKQLFKILVEDITHKDQRISKLAGQMRQMTIEVNELERYDSKDSFIFHNLPIGAKVYI